METNNLSIKQKEFYDLVMSGENVFLQGKAGTGKSFVTKLAINGLRSKGKNIVALAPTGIAAINIDGATIHSVMSLPPFGVLEYKICNFVKDAKRKMLAKVDVFLIDEVSMLRPDILDGINWTLIKNGCGSLKDRQVIFVGDMKQLGIVADDNMISVMLERFGGKTFQHASIYKDLDVQEIELDEILRQSNPDFIEALNTIRDGKKHSYFKQFVSREPNGIILAPRNSTVQDYNLKGLQSIEGKTYEFKAHLDGNVKIEDFNIDPLIKVKDGSKIMYLSNSKNNPLVNGTLGIFKVADPGTPDERYFINVQGVDYFLNPIMFAKKDYVFNEETQSLELTELGTVTQMPIKLAYALTIHKSQGLTFDNVTIDLSYPCFAEGQMYVALSRVRTPEGLRIIIK